MEPRLVFYRPSPHLSAFVKKYYLFEGPNSRIVNIIPAWTKPILVLQCGGKIQASIGESGAAKPATLNGLVTKPYQLSSDSSSFKFFVVEFTPVGMYLFFRENSHQFINNSVNMFDVISSKSRHQLIEAISEVDDMENKVAVVENFLSNFVPSEREFYRIRHVIDSLDLIYSSQGATHVNEIASYLGFTPKHIRSGFKEVIGLSPKKYARILRFTNSFNDVMDSHGFLSEARSFNGYYDPSHFSREFKVFTDFSPNSLPKEKFLFARLFSGF